MMETARGAEDTFAVLYGAQASPCASLERANGIPPSPVSLPRDIEALLRQWRAAPRTGPHSLPFFEELALGSLGRLADSIALVQADTSESMTVFRVGDTFATWIEAANPPLVITLRSTGRARALFEIAAEAFAENLPVRRVVHALVDFNLCSDDLVALPLHTRWGPPLCLVYVHTRERTCNLLESLFQASAEGLVALALIRGRNNEPRDFQILTLNNGAAALLHRTVAELGGQRLSEVGISLGESSVITRFLDVLATGENARFELDLPIAGGEVVHLNIGAAPLGDFIALTLSNIDDVKRREASFRLLFENNPVPMWLCDSAGNSILAVNDAAIALYGYDRPAFLAMRIRDIVSCSACEGPRAIKVNSAGSADFEQISRHVTAEGAEIDVHIYGRSVTFEGVPANLLTIIDITEQRRAEARIEHMAHHDSLTGLPNRYRLAQELDGALHARGHGSGVALLYLDLDRFKNVNDTLGHLLGDRLLCAVADRLRDTVRNTDLVARLGGDEFAIVQPELECPEAADQLAARIVDKLCVPFELDGRPASIGVSIGIAIAPVDGDEAHVLQRNADVALYRAKAQGRRTFLRFSPEMDTRILARSALEGCLEKACAENEFELYYQPVVDLETDRITGFEALLRWKHPSRGLIGPAEFIPLAEETGLIVPLGEWVLRRACAEAKTWPANLTVSVNLSAVQFKFGNLPATVTQALVASGLAPHRLDLEITESVLLDESEKVLSILRTLRSLGVGISMDDFGTGYSCLTYLRAFPFTKIKIDKSFVDEITADEQSTAIVRAVTALGVSLGVSITAEGVETREQLEWLRREGCTAIQGYYYSRPVPASTIVNLLASQGLPTIRMTRARQPQGSHSASVTKLPSLS